MFSKARALGWPAAICLSSVCLLVGGCGIGWLGSWFLFLAWYASVSAVFRPVRAKTRMVKKKGEENKGNIAALGKWRIAGEKSKSYKRQITRVWLEFYTLLSNSIPLLSSGVPFGSYLLGRPDASEMEECTARKTAEKNMANRRTFKI